MAAPIMRPYINNELLCDCGADSNYSVTSTGLRITQKSNLVAEWTYSGNNQFLGFSKIQDATTAEYGVDSIGILYDIQDSGDLYLYSVESAYSSVTYYKTSSDELTSIADAIRSKAGISNSLEFPTGFVNAITNL